MSRPRRFGVVLGLTLGVIGSTGHAQVTENSKAAALEQCVEPTEFMRKNHMEVLDHQRDATVHRGIRSKRHSLTQCIACHAARNSGGKFVPVNAEGQFCQSCHAAVAVDLDCFQCHATSPEANAAASDGSVFLADAGYLCLR